MGLCNCLDSACVSVLQNDFTFTWICELINVLEEIWLKQDESLKQVIAADDATRVNSYRRQEGVINFQNLP